MLVFYWYLQRYFSTHQTGQTLRIDEGERNKVKTHSSSSSFGFSLFGVATARKHFPFIPIDFVSLLSSNLFHVFSRQIHLEITFQKSAKQLLTDDNHSFLMSTLQHSVESCAYPHIKSLEQSCGGNSSLV